MSIAATHESNAPCSRYLAKLSARKKPNLLAPDIRPCLGDNIPVDLFQCTADINNNVVDIYFLVWNLSRLLCCVGSGSIVAAAYSTFAYLTLIRHFATHPPAAGLLIVTDNKISSDSPHICAVPVTDSCVVYICVPSLKLTYLNSSV
jgi:hypothetical protein